MKYGKSISELAAELERQAEAKQDYVVDSRELTFDGEHVGVPGQGEFALNDHAHGQVAQFTGIPKSYYDRMRSEAPALLTSNVRQWFDNEPGRRMVRTLDGNARAFLSDRYRRIDNDNIFMAAGQALVDSGAEVQVLSTEVTDSRLYIQARFPKLEGEVKRGDPVQGGLIITNSEVGAGALQVKPLIYRLVCTNGMVVGKELNENGLRKQHIGRKVEADENYAIYSEETLKADDKALMLKIRDSILALSNQELFFELMERMKATTEGPVIKNPIKAVEVLGKQLAITKQESDLILENLIRERDYSRWGALNAVTALANETASYDRAVELEELGGKVLDLSASVWGQIAEAA